MLRFKTFSLVMKSKKMEHYLYWYVKYYETYAYET